MGEGQQCYLGQSMQLIGPPGGGARGRASIACRHGSLARPYTLAGTSAHASHAEDIGAVLVQGLRFMVCVYLFFRNVAQCSDYTMPSVQAYIRVLFSHGMKLIIMKGSLTVYLGLGFVNCVFRTIAQGSDNTVPLCGHVSESNSVME